MTLQVTDAQRVRTITLDRPEALNAFNEALYDATTEALLAAADDPGVAVVLLTGNGRGFSAGTDLLEMHERATNPDFVAGKHGFIGMIDALVAFPKPLICAVNGLGLGIGATILGFADLAFMSTAARLKCPFTSLGVAPEAASSYLFPRLMGRQDAAWMLLSAEWISAEQALEMGLVWRVCEPDELLPEARRHAELLAARPISSLVAVKRTMTEPLREQVRAARDRENAAFAELMGGPANLEALTAFAEGREPDFTEAAARWVTWRRRTVYSHSRSNESHSLLVQDEGPGMTDEKPRQRRPRLDHESVLKAAEHARRPRGLRHAVDDPPGRRARHPRLVALQPRGQPRGPARRDPGAGHEAAQPPRPSRRHGPRRCRRTAGAEPLTAGVRARTSRTATRR